MPDSWISNREIFDLLIKQQEILRGVEKTVTTLEERSRGQEFSIAALERTVDLHKEELDRAKGGILMIKFLGSVGVLAGIAGFVKSMVK